MELFGTDVSLLDVLLVLAELALRRRVLAVPLTSSAPFSWYEIDVEPCEAVEEAEVEDEDKEEEEVGFMAESEVSWSPDGVSDFLSNVGLAKVHGCYQSQTICVHQAQRFLPIPCNSTGYLAGIPLSWSVC
ncbi:MAG: hypothetical protein ACRYGK_12865 [Janthinobacterium lividum]